MWRLVRKVGHIIEFEDLGDASTIQQTFEQVRKILLSQYGTLAQTFERGHFSQRLGEDLREGEFIRAMEWETPQGKIRFGIPRRTDGKVRLEVQYARHFPALADPNWSFEEVS